MFGGAEATIQEPEPNRILKLVAQGLRWLNRFCVSVGLVAIVVFCFGQALDRYTLHTSFDAYDQLGKVGLVWLVFSGMALGYEARENLRIDLFSRHWSPWALRLRDILFELAVLAICVLVHIKAWDVVEVAAMQPIIGTPLTSATSYSAILLGTVSIAFTCMVRLAALVRPRRG